MRYLIISFFILVFGYFGLLNQFRSGFMYVVAPIQYGLRQVAIDIGGAVNFFIHLNAIRSDNLLLLKENKELTSRMLALKRLEEENSALYKQLKVVNSFDKQLLIASVLGNPEDPTGASIILDKGSRHGIRKGNNVISGNYLIGVVSDVTSERSWVNLVVSSEVSTTVYDIDSVTKTQGLAIGQHGTSISMTRILPDEQINVGDMIVTSGKDGLFVPGLLVGKVVKIHEVSADPLKEASLEMLFNISHLDRVFIIL